MRRASKGKYAAALAVLLLATAGLHAGTSIPDGTVLPARLNTTLSSKNAKAGQTVTARIMQNVPLPGGAKIPEGATLVGRVTRVTTASNGTFGTISVRFNFLRMPHEHIALTTHLRAIASFTEVEQAQVPVVGSDRGTPASAATTIQIGGETVYRGGGHVDGKFGRVGEPVYDGVLGHLYASADGECRGDTSADPPQALWLFSSDACGAYGMPDLVVAHPRRSVEPGEITLRSTKGDVNVRSGAGLLLRVGLPPDPQT
jgi:hypothetical protein